MEVVDFSYTGLITSLQGLNIDPQVEKLELSRNNISRIEELEALTNLQRLYLTSNYINNNEIEGLKYLTKLRKLDLDENYIDRIEGLKTLTNLEKLELAFNEIRKIEGLETLVNLKILDLDGNNISKIEGLETLTNLRKLYLLGNPISKIEGLETLTNLQTLSLNSDILSRRDYQYTDYILKRNKEIQWDVVRPQFIDHCLALHPLNLPVLIVIHIFDMNSYPNHFDKKWEIAKRIKEFAKT